VRVQRNPDLDDSYLNEDDINASLNELYGRKSNVSGASSSHTFVGRLSRWEGGNQVDPTLFSKPAKDCHGVEADRVSMADSELAYKLTWRDLLLIFRKDEELCEVTEEDISRVKIMHAKFMEGSKFNFNYNTLLFIASIIAACGLGSNGTAAVIASMLVSPLMGPVMGMAYASTIRDFNMFRIAIVTEFLSLFCCVVTGIAVAVCMIPFSVSDDWPNSEMYSRGTMTNFWVGFPIAFASGLGVAVGILDEQTSSLVGVAISASLLPPAVNTGMLWLSYFVYDQENHPDSNLTRRDFFKMGLTSFGLTLVNIVLIIISSMLMFRIKERLPIKKSIFWSDLGLARKVYQNLAIIPIVQHGPTKQEIAKRVTRIMRESAFNFETKYGNSKGSSKGSVPPKEDARVMFHIESGIPGHQSPHMQSMQSIQEEDQPIMESVINDDQHLTASMDLGTKEG